MSQLDPELRERIEEPASEEAEREARLTPAQATGQMGINDHSWVHIQIVANIALRLLRLLAKRGVEPAMVDDYGMENEDAEVVVVLGALLHCIGMAVHRDRHEDWSLFLADPKARALLQGIYEEPELTVVVCEVLQAITSHRESGHPLTLEAGIVRVADALDIEEGRSRIPFERGRVSIHSISAAAIDEVVLSEGKERAVSVEIKMNNSAGVYQIDELLKSKLHGSGLEPYVEVLARIRLRMFAIRPVSQLLRDRLELVADAVAGLDERVLRRPLVDLLA